MSYAQVENVENPAQIPVAKNAITRGPSPCVATPVSSPRMNERAEVDGENSYRESAAHAEPVAADRHELAHPLIQHVAGHRAPIAVPRLTSAHAAAVTWRPPGSRELAGAGPPERHRCQGRPPTLNDEVADAPSAGWPRAMSSSVPTMKVDQVVKPPQKPVTVSARKREPPLGILGDDGEQCADQQRTQDVDQQDRPRESVRGGSGTRGSVRRVPVHLPHRRAPLRASVPGC